MTHFVFVKERSTNNPIQGQAVDCARRSVGLPSGQLFFYIECDYRNTPKTTLEITIPVKSNKNNSSGESSEESSKEESLESIESNSKESSEETIDKGAEIGKLDLSLLKRVSTQ